MSGLDKIVEEIRRQAESESRDILKKADEYCDAYMEKTGDRVREETDSFNVKEKNKRQLYEEKVQSGMEFKERNAILNAKQQCINKCMTRAYDNIKELPLREYFDLLITILKNNIQKGSGIMKLGAADLDRMPEDFEKQVENVAKEQGGDLKISEKPADIEDGFILIYGEIEENCTFKALFDTNADRLKDIANNKLFAVSGEYPVKD